MATGISRDRAFAIMFGTKAAAPVPLVVFLIWMCRDVCTITGGLILPARVKAIYQAQGWSESSAK